MLNSRRRGFRHDLPAYENGLQTPEWGLQSVTHDLARLTPVLLTDNAALHPFERRSFTYCVTKKVRLRTPPEYLSSS